MNRILGVITTLDQHFDEVANGGDVYRPVNCPYCQAGGLWRHGCYCRKADRTSSGDASRNPVPILRFLCRSCERTCSRLPACIAPRRWFDWNVQQVILLMLMAGVSLWQCCLQTGRALSTVRRWRDWISTRSDNFEFFLRSRFPELGRAPEPDAFWRQVMNTISLSQAMAWLNQYLVVP
ncbi:MAG: hypothetical protein Q8L38_03935 [Pseudohongiella sp.]|nr:hypothetical protein [Pseudohongiella sp.]